MKSEATKRFLAVALKELMKTKSFDKVTVKDLTEYCDINRQTFYYHFIDIRDLMEWIIYEDSKKILANNKTAETWEKGYLDILVHLMEPLRDRLHHLVEKRFRGELNKCEGCKLCINTLFSIFERLLSSCCNNIETLSSARKESSALREFAFPSTNSFSKGTRLFLGKSFFLFTFRSAV